MITMCHVLVKWKAILCSIENISYGRNKEAWGEGVGQGQTAKNRMYIHMREHLYGFE